MQGKRWFQIAFFQFEQIQKLLDMMIYVLNPAEKLPAHVTLKGPFKAEASASRNPSNVYGASISIVGTGRFPQPQLTVFLRCDASAIKENWWKPNYGYQPHITIYDGDSAGISSGAFSILNNMRIFARISLGRTVVYASQVGQKSMMLPLAIDYEQLSLITRRSFTANHSGELTVQDRLDCLSLVAQCLKETIG